MHTELIKGTYMFVCFSLYNGMTNGANRKPYPMFRKFKGQKIITKNSFK